MPYPLAVLSTSRRGAAQCWPLCSRERFICQEGNGTIHQSVSWMWKAKTYVFGCVDVAPGRMSYWTPGRKNSEGVSWKA
jgi:hypothetical protein